MLPLWVFLPVLNFVSLIKAQGPPQEYYCDPEHYGRPENQDCENALARLPDWALTASAGVEEGWEMIREFVNIGTTPMIPDSANNIRTPLIYNNGTCIVAVMIPDDWASNYMLLDTRKLNAKADSLRAKCVEELGSGGLFHGVRESGRGLDIEDYPNVLICGKDSNAGRLLDYLYNCVTDASGNSICKEGEREEENDDDWLKFIENVELPGPETPIPKGSKQACSGSCLNPEDCDIGSDCLCASNKGIPLSSTWGQHTCMYVAGAAIALASTAIKPQGPCRGRCVLEENGTVEIEEPTNHVNTTSSIAIPLVNVTEILNSSFSDPVAKPSPGKDGSYPSGIPPSTSSAKASLESSPILTCPCNCTYVSAACCLSRVVWEAPSKQIRMEPPPENASVVCDTGSGNWEPKSFASKTTTEEKNGFIGLGSVKWNSSAASPVMIPKESQP